MMPIKAETALIGSVAANTQDQLFFLYFYYAILMCSMVYCEATEVTGHKRNEVIIETKFTQSQ